MGRDYSFRHFWNRNGLTVMQMDAIYQDGISRAPISETWPRMTPNLFPQLRVVSLPQLGANAVAHVKLVATGGEILANVESWEHNAARGPLTDFVPTREQDEAAQEQALDLV